MNMKQKIAHTLVSITFFMIGFLSLGYFVMTSTGAQVLGPYIDMGVSGEFFGQQGGTYSTSSSSVDVYWFVNNIVSCNLSRTDTSTIIASYSYTLADYSQETPAEIVTLNRPSYAPAVQTIPYQLRCLGSNGQTVSDTITITYTNTSLVGASTPSSSVGDISTPFIMVNHSIDLGVAGELMGQQGGSITIDNDSTFTLSWTATNVVSCRLRNAINNTTLVTRSYVPTETINDSFVVLGNISASSDYTRSYQLVCYDDSGNNLGSDMVTLNVVVPVNANTACPIDIEYFDVDQDDVYADDVDDDVRLSWASTSPANCSHACTLTYEGDTYQVTNNNTNRTVNNIDSDHTFVLECYEIGNPNNSVTSTEYVDYHSGTSSNDDEDPELATLSAQQVGSSTARIRGTYNDGDCSSLETGFLFGTQINNMSLLNGYADRSGSGTATLLLQGLAPGTTYYYRHVGDGCSGISTGSLKTFTTTGSSLPYIPYTPPQTTTITTTTGNTTLQQVSVQNVEEDGTVGEAQFNTFDIGVGYVPQSHTRARGGFPSGFGDWLLIIGLIGLVIVAGKFINEAMTDPNDSHKLRY